MKLPLLLDIQSSDRLAMDQDATDPPLKVQINDANGEPVPVSEYRVRFQINGEATRGRIDTTGDVIEYQWKPEDTSDPGEYQCQFVLQSGGGKIIKAPSYSPARLTIYRGP